MGFDDAHPGFYNGPFVGAAGYEVLVESGGLVKRSDERREIQTEKQSTSFFSSPPSFKTDTLTLNRPSAPADVRDPGPKSIIKVLPQRAHRQRIRV